MEIESFLNGVLLLKPKVHQDHRGHFFESFRQDILRDNGVELDFIQDNQSLSNAGILRGLHFQAPPHAQGKLVRVIKGAVRDVVVDIRRQSPSYGQFACFDLSEDNFHAVYVPPGFAHGFLTLRDHTIFTYKCTDYYHPETEGGIKWDSPELDIPWNVENPVLSDKDLKLPQFSTFESPFNDPI